MIKEYELEEERWEKCKTENKKTETTLLKLDFKLFGP